MKDYIVRFLIAGFLGVCISLLILGGRQVNAEELNPGMDWIWPTEGIVSDVYGTRGGTHKGIDIAGQQGTTVVASNEGTVEKSYLSSTYGNVILINHPNGYVTVYAHLDERLVNEGQAVNKGEKIGTMGNTGYSTGVHLHFEMHRSEWTFKKENAINPASLIGMKAAGESVAFSESDSREAGAMKDIPKEKAGLSEGTMVHTVVSGETLWGIAQDYGLDIQGIMEMNILNSSTIFPGQLLKLGEAFPSAPFEELGIPSPNNYLIEHGTW
jgi:LysM repeat protein